MFKKIEIWILYLFIILSILFAILFGTLVRQELVGSTKLGWVSKLALQLAEMPVNIRDFLLPTNRTKDRFPNLKKGFNGSSNFYESFMLLSRFDGDLNQGVVELIDLTNFQILHTWNPNIDDFNNLVIQENEFVYLNRDKNDKRSFFRHPLLTNDGGLLIKEFSPLRKIDSCSNLIFQNTHDIFHHSIETDYEGNIWAVTSAYPQTLPKEQVGRNIHQHSGFMDDAIVKLSSKGEVLYEKSVASIFIDNGLEYLLFSVGEAKANTIYLFNPDPIHLNDIQPVNQDGDFWKKGDLFLSLRHQSMVLLYRPSNNKIIWKSVGHFFQQHDVDIIDNHRISIFNNNSKNFVDRNRVDGHNKVVIYDFKSNEYSEYLSDSFREHDIRTITQGLSEILPNGDLFVEETNYSRILYFNSDGSLRWSYLNRGNDNNTYTLGWSRILATKDEVDLVKNFLEKRGSCYE